MPPVQTLKYGRFWLVFGWLAIVAALIVCLLPPQYVEVPNANDKMEHALGYVLLTLWFCGIYPRSQYWKIAVGYLIFGAVIEMLQSWMHLGRNGDINDMVADAAGIAVGVLLGCTPLGRWPHWIEFLFLRR